MMHYDSVMTSQKLLCDIGPHSIESANKPPNQLIKAGLYFVVPDLISGVHF